jgi:hypothetical protein
VTFKGFDSRAESEWSRMFGFFPPKPGPKEGFISCVSAPLAMPLLPAALLSLLTAVGALKDDAY